MIVLVKQRQKLVLRLLKQKVYLTLYYNGGLRLFICVQNTGL